MIHSAGKRAQVSQRKRIFQAAKHFSRNQITTLSSHVSPYCISTVKQFFITLFSICVVQKFMENFTATCYGETSVSCAFLLPRGVNKMTQMLEVTARSIWKDLFCVYSLFLKIYGRMPIFFKRATPYKSDTIFFYYKNLKFFGLVSDAGSYDGTELFCVCSVCPPSCLAWVCSWLEFLSSRLPCLLFFLLTLSLLLLFYWLYLISITLPFSSLPLPYLTLS